MMMQTLSLCRIVDVMTTSLFSMLLAKKVKNDQGTYRDYHHLVDIHTRGIIHQLNVGCCWWGITRTSPDRDLLRFCRELNFDSLHEPEGELLQHGYYRAEESFDHC